jgi:hypothetical protein
MLQVSNTNLPLQHKVNFYNLSVHKTKVHLNRTLQTNAFTDHNAVADSKINQGLNFQN